MPFPDFNEFGDLPEGIHPASLPEVIARFGAEIERMQHEVLNYLTQPATPAAAKAG